MFRIAFLGDSGVGKTTLICSHIAKKYVEDKEPTIGVDFYNIPPIQWWDTAGAPENAGIFQTYVRDAAIVVLAFSSSDSFVSIHTHWLPIVYAYAPPTVKLMLVRCKSDLDGVITRDKIYAAYACDIGATYTTVTSTRTTSIESFVNLLELQLHVIASHTEQHPPCRCQ